MSNRKKFGGFEVVDQHDRRVFVMPKHWPCDVPELARIAYRVELPKIRASSEKAGITLVGFTTMEFGDKSAGQIVEDDTAIAIFIDTITEDGDDQAAA